MPNPLKGEAVLELADGRRFQLVLDMEALLAGEQAYGKPLELLLRDTIVGLVGAHRALLAGAMQRHHADLTLNDLTAMILANRIGVIETLTDLIQKSHPDIVEGDQVGNGSQRPAGTGSGRSGAKRGSTPKNSGGKPRAASH